MILYFFTKFQNLPKFRISFAILFDCINNNEDYRPTHAQRFRYIQIVIHIIPRKLSSGIEIQKFWYVFLELFRLLAEKNTLIRSKIIDIL